MRGCGRDARRYLNAGQSQILALTRLDPAFAPSLTRFSNFLELSLLGLRTLTYTRLVSTFSLLISSPSSWSVLCSQPATATTNALHSLPLRSSPSSLSSPSSTASSSSASSLRPSVTYCRVWEAFTDLAACRKPLRASSSLNLRPRTHYQRPPSSPLALVPATRAALSSLCLFLRVTVSSYQAGAVTRSRSAKR